MKQLNMNFTEMTNDINKIQIAVRKMASQLSDNEETAQIQMLLSQIADDLYDAQFRTKLANDLKSNYFVSTHPDPNNPN